MGKKIVLWRSENTKINAWKDYFAHRGAPLSLGSLKNCKLVCPYHGWHFDDGGKCVHVPAHPEQASPAKSVVQAYAATEKYGFIWVSIGTPTTNDSWSN